MAAKKTNVKNEPVATGDRKAALETVISRIERDCGKGSIMRLGEVSNLNVEAVSTGSLSLDLALGVGGIPKGRITEIYGPESSGKTTVALHVVAESSDGCYCYWPHTDNRLSPHQTRSRHWHCHPK